MVDRAAVGPGLADDVAPVQIRIGSDGHRQCAVAVVAYERRGDPAHLLGGGSIAEVFTPAERRWAARGATLDSWAGRLAAKHAVRALLGHLGVRPEPALGAVEVVGVPDGRCFDPRRCEQGHPLQVRFAAQGVAPAGLAPRIRTSISHDAGVAVAIAMVDGEAS